MEWVFRFCDNLLGIDLFKFIRSVLNYLQFWQYFVNNVTNNKTLIDKTWFRQSFESIITNIPFWFCKIPFSINCFMSQQGFGNLNILFFSSPSNEPHPSSNLCCIWNSFSFLYLYPYPQLLMIPHFTRLWTNATMVYLPSSSHMQRKTNLEFHIRESFFDFVVS